MILPVIITINSAPVLSHTSLTVILNGSLHSKFFGSSDKEYCVFAIQIGKSEYPRFSICFIFSFVPSSNSISSAPYIFLATFLIFSSIESSKSKEYLKSFCFSHNSTIFSAKSTAPSPPF